MLDPKFIADVMHDTQILKRIQSKWFGDSEFRNDDPKSDDLAKRIHALIQDNHQRKIVVFSVSLSTPLETLAQHRENLSRKSLMPHIHQINRQTTSIFC